MPRRPIPNTPALSIIFQIVGGLCVLGGVVLGVLGIVASTSARGAGWLAVLPGTGGMVVLGIIYFGLAEVIQLIARIAQECARAADAAEQTAASSSAPQSARALYFYQYGGEVRGPALLADLRTMRAMPVQPRMVTGETLVCQQGTEEWKRLAEVMQ